MKKFLYILIIPIFLAGCEDILSPELENNRNLQDIYDDAAFAEGLLINAYRRIPDNSLSYLEAATDNAVINDKVSSYRNMATGQWSAIYNPVEQWTNAYAAINYINFFIKHIDSVKWSILDTVKGRLFKERNLGEAYGLRALFMFYLLQAHAGYVGDKLMGVPILTEFVDAKTISKLERNTFEECINQIYSDIAEAEKYLPLEYRNITKTNQLPPRYSNVDIGTYNKVFGDINRQRISGGILKALKAKVALLKASPAYGGTQEDWETAANYAADVIINVMGGLSKIDPEGFRFYKASNIDNINLTIRRDQREMLWRGSIYNTYDPELNNYPPSLYGNGRINPSQNLVDAFPMANGYPIDHPSSGYDPENPYANRDPRFYEYIIYNGSSFAGKVIRTDVNSPTDDGIDRIKTSTRTGYYLKKLLREDVNLDPTARTAKARYPVFMRYTDILLIYAEAANEAWGPDGTGGFGISARNVIAALRKRAGIAQPDNYLNSITTKEEMRELIRNERRLELCFEGYRFWDLRRWKVDLNKLNEPVKGIRIYDSYSEIDVIENRIYKDYMYYGPIPYNEVIKNNLSQNNGW